MSTQVDRATLFAGLHQAGRPLILFNVWDAGSATALVKAGAKAIATGSWSVAAAHGFEDGERIPLDLAVANAARIVAAVELPVSIDFEAGYGETPREVAHSLGQLFGTGAVGCNLEDGIPTEQAALYSIGDAAKRVRAARAAAEEARIPGFINARTDLFLQADPADHGASLGRQALERARAYADNGASGFFVPGLVDPGLIEMICGASPLPVNILTRATAPSNRRLAELGVARVSYGPGPYRLAMRFLEEEARTAFEG